MKYTNTLLTSALAPTLITGAATLPAAADSFTDFEGFTTGTSVDGQGGWSVSNAVFGGTNAFDEAVVDDGTGNLAWRVSNAVTSQNFPSQPISPTSGQFAGESSTGAAYTQFIGSFRFMSATGAMQQGLSITVSASDGSDTGRHGFIDIEESDVVGSGLDIQTFDVDTNGNFSAETIAAGLSYTEWHDFRLEIDFFDGPDNDVARYYVNDVLVHTSGSWEQYYTNYEPLTSPNGVAVQSFMYRISNDPATGTLGGGFLIDDVSVQLVPEPGSIALLGLGGLALIRRRRRA